jgi:hypothetical protein
MSRTDSNFCKSTHNSTIARKIAWDFTVDSSEQRRYYSGKTEINAGELRLISAYIDKSKGGDSK